MAQIGEPTSTPTVGNANPTSKTPQSKPCDLDKIQIKCKHCGEVRKNFPEGVFWVDHQQKKVLNSYPSPTTSLTSSKRTAFGVTANSEADYADEVTIRITPAADCGKGEHPSIQVIEPRDMGGRSTLHRGKKELVLNVGYPKDWFTRCLNKAKNQPGLDGLLLFFFPDPVVYQVLVRSCGQPPPGRATFGSWQHEILVYTDDRFKLAIKIPSARKSEWKRGGGRNVGDSNYRTSEKTRTTGFGRNVDSSKETTYTTNQGNKVLEQTDSVRDRTGGLKQTQTLGETGTTVAYRNKEGSTDKTDSVLLQTARTITFSHNGNDISEQFSFVRFVEKILKLKKTVLDFIDMLQKLASAMPQIGWSLTWSLEVLAGSLDYEWGWKEWKKDNTIFKYWKVNLDFTLISSSVKLSFGINILEVCGEIYGSISADLKLSTSMESNPESLKPPSITAKLNSQAELGVRAALGDIIEVNGKIVGGLTGETKIEFAPFKWTAKVAIAKGKGVFTVKALWSLWQCQNEAQLWPERPLLDEFQII